MPRLLSNLITFPSETHRQPNERIEVLGGFGDAEVAPTVELNVLGQRISESSIQRDDQFTFGELAEKFPVTSEITDDVMTERDRVDKVRSVAIIFAVNDVEFRHHSHVPAIRQFHGQRKNDIADSRFRH